MKFTQEERYILKQVKIILKNEVQYLKLLTSAMNLIYFKWLFISKTSDLVNYIVVLLVIF